ncbi:MAG: beta-galactosidase [Planctomycetota bacterium]|nr:beta-galactosidase [Planctomycetota bacterium]
MSTTRRDFLKQVAVAGTIVAVSDLVSSASAAPAQTQPGDGVAPWYRRTLRWGQTNITELDIERYDIPWWRQHWKRTRVQGVVINAGGIFAYYPSKFELHHRPPQLKDRDLYGELARAAHEDGLAVFARMDSSKAHEALYRARPDWFSVDADGQPYRSGEFYLSCINSPYYSAWLPGIMREIIERSHPEGVTDNIWAGTERNQICYCANCARGFQQFAGAKLPAQRDWNDTSFRRWVEWSYARRIEQWDFNNKVTRDAGGKDCIWVGMNGGGISGQSASFRDLKEICGRAEMFMLDNQSRSDAWGLQENALAGKIVRSVLGWDKVMPESMAMYQHGRPQFRLSTKSQPEARMWMLSGIAGGIQPWWHHVGAYHEDRRMYETAEPVMKWHQENEQYLVNRRPVASVGIAWSHRNTEFFGRDNAEALVDQPFRGWVQALVRARIPYTPVHLDYLDRDAKDLSVLILPNIGVMTDEQIASARRFAGSGKALVASGQTSLFDQWGDARPDMALADLFGAKGAKGAKPQAMRIRATGAVAEQHTYLRLTPELRALVYGPETGNEPAITSQRHAVLSGFDETDILPFGGTLQALTVDAGARVLATFIPSFPATPPEISYMRTERTDVPGLIVNETQPGRVVYLPADIDRLFALDNLPDHGDLLANIVRWAARDSIPLKVRGAGLINCELYRQVDGSGAERLILHLVNLTSAGTWRAPIHELIPVGPLQVSVTGPAGKSAASVKSLVSGKTPARNLAGGWCEFEVESVLDHEVLVIEI